jgi:putative ABC transport system permease protein
MSTVLADFRYALRSLAHRPGFSAAVVLVLALGLGAVTAVFSVLDRALVRPLAADGNGSRWSRVVIARDRGASINENLSYPLFADVRDRGGAFDAVLAHSPVSLTLNTGAEVERLDAGAVSAGFFGALGLALPLGREILPAEDRPGAAQRVVVLSYPLWQRRFGGDRAVLGRSVSLNGDPFTVVGVAPAGFLGPVRGAAEAAWIPITASTTAGGPDVFFRRTVSWLDVMARRTPGTDGARAQAGLDLLGTQLARDSLFAADSRLTLADGAAGLTYLVSNLRRPLAILFGASVLVLLVAGANLAGLLLARATTRQRELAIRLSLGASRWRIARLFLTEGVVLGLLGSAGGLVVASWLGGAAPALRTMFGQELQLSGGLDLRSAMVSGVLALLLAALIAASPVAWASTLELSRGLKDGGGSPGSHGGLLRGRLVVVQLALAVVLVAGGLLLGFTARRLAAVDPGYRAKGVLLAGVDLNARGYRRAQAATFWATVTTELRASPAVAGATVAQTITPTPGGMHYNEVVLEGSDAAPEQVGFDLNMVGPAYFGTLDIPVLSGREFSDEDRMGSQGVALVNQAMARRYWGDRSPLGRRMWLDGDTTTPAVTVVGVVADGKYRSLRESPLPVVFLASLQSPPVTATLLVRARPGIAPGALGPLVRETVRRLDAGVPVYDLRPLSTHLALASATERLLSFLAGMYAVLATVLAAVGLFGLLSYHVARRTHDIGIRLALGAEPARIRQQVVRQGLVHGLGGVCIGIGLSLAAGRWVGSLLYDVSPLDPAILLAVAALMLGVVLLASWWPAARAARVDPMVALRSE